MGRLANYYSDWFKPILGGKNYDTWKQESLSLQKVKIENTKLANELEDACKKHGGFLTYSEFLQIDQFGKNGFHATNKYHGFTPTYKNWAPAALTILKKKNIHTIVELGPGNAGLAADLFLLCKKVNYELTWHAVEIGDEFRATIKAGFTPAYKNFLGSVVDTPEKLPQIENALLISSYCIDSVPPEILINTTRKIDYPNSAIGVRVSNGNLEEFILSPAQLIHKGITIKNGVFILDDVSFDISDFQLAPYQRAYIIFKGLNLFLEALGKIKNPTALIIDEFRPEKNVFRTDHILAPLYLNVGKRYGFNPQKAYIRAGEMLYYYPLYLSMAISFLKSLGLTKIEYDTEKKFAQKILGKKIQDETRVRYSLCYALLASGVFKKPKKIFLDVPN